MTQQQALEVDRLRDNLSRLSFDGDGPELLRALGALRQIADELDDGALQAEHRRWQRRLVPFADAT